MSSILNFAGALKEGHDAKAAADYNAKMLDQQASTARAQGLQDEYSQRRNSRQFLGSQAASIAQAGGGNGGTAAMIGEQSAVSAELDALNIRYGASMRSQGLISQAVGERMRGKAAQTAGYFKAGSALLSGAEKSISGGG